MISGRTRLVALLGQPVAGSLSPRMQNAAFAARGLDWAYVACDVAPEQLREAARGLAAAGFAGANVTTPHKAAAAALAETDLESVNTLVFEDGRIRGYSTDAAVLEGLTAERAVVLGDGGAARAFRAALPAGAHLRAARRLAARRRTTRICGQRDLGARRRARRARPRPDARRPAVSRRRRRRGPPARQGARVDLRPRGARGQGAARSSSGPACPRRSRSMRAAVGLSS